MSSFEKRLVSERRRLGLNQTEFGALAGVQKQAQIHYESGNRKPNSAYLEALALTGVDIGYLFTGVKTIGDREVQAELTALSEAWEAIDCALADAQKTLPPEKKRKAAEALYMAVKHGEGEAKPLARLLSKAA